MSSSNEPQPSPVPGQTFSRKLSEQEAELASNPFVERFAASRRAMSRDRHRPAYHFVSPESTLNDPNGLCFWRGRWHLFYQGYPPECPRRVHWGHAVSDDLIHWRDLPYAIAPDIEASCFSGATFVEEKRVIAMYHGTEAGNMVAVADDPLLLNWAKFAGNPVIPLRNPDGSPRPYRVFDPCIWRQGDMYYSLSGWSLPQGPGGKHVRANILFRSPDMRQWEYVHPFVEDDRYSLVGDDGACPYFWPIGDRHMLLHYSHISGGKYLLGDYDTDREKFIVTDGDRFNFGASAPGGVHAPSATPDGQGGLIVIFNMNAAMPTEGWDQVMSLPRRLTLDQAAPCRPLRQEPVEAVTSLRGEHRRIENLTLPPNKEVPLEGVRGNTMELLAEIDPAPVGVLEMNVLRSTGGEEQTRIRFYRERGLLHRELGPAHPHRDARDSIISIDVSCASQLHDVSPRPPENAPVLLDADEPVRLHVFIDRSIMEVFVNGKQCVAARVYPGRDDSTGVSLCSRGQGAVLRSLDAWQMRSIYE